MKKTLTIIITAALAAGFALGCENSAPAGNEAAPNNQGPAKEVRAVSQSGQSLAAVMDDLGQELDRLEEQGKTMSRTAQLDESKVYDFNLAGAASNGPETAKLTMVVFSDFECPFCSRFAAASKQLAAKYPNDLRVVFMNFPLDNKCNSAISREFHKRACLGAEAGMAAAAQGKFWEMHDWLYQNQRTFSPESIAAAAPTLGLDAAAVKDAIDTNKYAVQLQDQARQLLTTPGRGTPTVFINGMMVQNARWDDLNSVSEFIDGLLHPETQEALEPKAAVAVPNPGSLPPAKVVLEDGTLLEDRLNNLKERISKINLRPDTPAPQKPKTPDPNKAYSFDLTKSPSLGASNAPVTVVVFTDLLSPQSKVVAIQLKEILAQFPDKARWVFKNLPGRGRQSAIEAHEAAMAANAQGKFWAMHDLILQNRDPLTLEMLRKFAEQIGLDLAKYDDDMQKHPYRPAMIADIKDADQASVSMGPAVFINGKYQRDVRKEALIASIQNILGQGPQ